LKCEELGPKTAQRVLSKINKFLKQNWKFFQIVKKIETEIGYSLEKQGQTNTNFVTCYQSQKWPTLQALHICE
jgi:intein-encoded DNA endonuclease-like protein